MLLVVIFILTAQNVSAESLLSRAFNSVNPKLLTASVADLITVSNVQQKLLDEGLLSYTPTGVVDQVTINAVKTFQNQNNLKVDGIVGPQTLNVLIPSSNTTPSISNPAPSVTTTKPQITNSLYRGVVDRQVTKAQEILKTLGFFSGNTTTSFGPKTEQAVKSFQKAKGIEQTGTIGPKTRELLNNMTLVDPSLVDERFLNSITCPTNTTPYVKVLSPNGGEVFNIGDTVTIKWNFCNSNKVMQISLLDTRYDSNLETGEAIIGGINTTTGSYTWVVPPSLGELSGGLLNGQNVYKIHIATFPLQDDSNNFQFDYSDTGFTINGKNQNPLCNSLSQPSISVISPNGGEVYTQGQQFTVKWITCNAPAGAIVMVNLDNFHPGPGTMGATLIPQNSVFGGGNTTPTQNDGQEIYTIPTPQINSGIAPSTKYKVRAHLATGSSVGNINTLSYDYSDNYFTINGQSQQSSCVTINEPCIKVITPNGGEIFTQNSNNSISVQYSSVSGNNEFVQLGLVDANATNSSNVVGSPYLLKGWISAPGGPGGATPFSGGGFNWGAIQVCDLAFITCWPVQPGYYKVLAQIKDLNGNLSLVPNASNWDISDNSFKIVGQNQQNTILGQISMWYGKVNQHRTPNGVWMTDSDGVAGAGTYAQTGSEGWMDRKLEYCQRFWPNTTSIQSAGYMTINTWRSRGNVLGPYTSVSSVYDCVM